MTATTRGVPSRVLASPLILIYAFVGLVSLGTLLLLLPFTHHGDGITPFMDAFFTATSAITVTGLVIQDTAAYWTRTGQVFILGLMFIGGLGFMTIATFLLVMIGQRVTLVHQLLVKESLGINQLGGLVRVTFGIVLVAIGIQVVGFVALFARFFFIYPPAEAVWQAAFHSVSGFNNAGFIALSEAEGFAAFRSDPAVIAVIALLIVLGAISYWVIVDVAKTRRFSRFSLNTKLVLILTGVMLIVGTAVFAAFEYRNPETLGNLSVPQKIMSAFFQSISGRTAGFATENFDHTRQYTNFFYAGLMFIGGASASVAGGIKINTLAVVLIAVVSTMRGQRHASAFEREISQGQVRRAMAIGAVSIVFMFLAVLILAFSETSFQFADLLFESVSAFGTVGLSTGVTSSLSTWGQLILVVTMLVGRLGPLSIGLAITQRSTTEAYRYAQERITIG